ncbi:MAG: hypothetical protein EBZ50_07700 [Alphaproteobacteria bacterium]|jgi:flagellar export protein FliJ|nr:hypothetical protein [Alphaproteobacteria bacterium]
MKGLGTLMRLARVEIDARQRAIAEIDARLAGLDAQASAHEDAIARESAAAAADPMAALGFGAYFRAALTARQDFGRRRTLLSEEAQSIRAALNEAFLELKRLELVAERVASEAEKKILRAENAALDETAIARHARA